MRSPMPQLRWRHLLWLGPPILLWLALQFLDLDLSVVGVVTAARLAILLPFPAALGALELSQVLALTALGFSAAEGAAMGFLIRARDLLFGAVGLYSDCALLGVPALPRKSIWCAMYVNSPCWSC